MIGGCSPTSNLTRVFTAEVDLLLTVRNDVGGMGKLALSLPTSSGARYELLWKWSPKGFELHNTAKI